MEIIWQGIGYIVAGFIGWLIAKVMDRVSQTHDTYEVWADVAIERWAGDPSRLFRNTRVEGFTDPWVADVYIWTAGKKDIRKEMFAEPLTISVSNNHGEEKGRPRTVNTSGLIYQVEGTRVIVEPSLLRNHAVLHSTFIVEGRPTLTHNQPFADARVRSLTGDWGLYSGRRWSLLKRVSEPLQYAGIAAVIGFVTTVGSMFYEEWNGGDFYTLNSWGVAGAWVGGVGAAVFVIYIFPFLTADIGSLRSRHAQRRLRKLIDLPDLDIRRSHRKAKRTAG